ncbi:MAG TPA: hypothetical protein VMY99_00730 [Nevskiaceae bacterium]|nr:hypothetical protein [Nevskiaceae bacterium]
MNGDNQQPAGQREFAPNDEQAPVAQAAPQFDTPEASWTASEFIAHEKGAGWYGALALVALALAGIVYLLTRDEISAAIVIFVGFLFGVVAARKPRVLQYHLDDQGLYVGTKAYPYSNFRAFVVIDEGPFSSVMLLPLRRFALSLNIYFAPEDEEKVLQALSLRLPIDHRQPDALERFMHRIRF